MRHPIITAAIAAALIMPLPAFADAAPSELKLKFCSDAVEYAEPIMKARQTGVSVRAMIDHGNKAPSPWRDLVLKFIRDAYAQPAWNTPALQHKAVTDFGATVYSECMASQTDPGRP